MERVLRGHADLFIARTFAVPEQTHQVQSKVKDSLKASLAGIMKCSEKSFSQWEDVNAEKDEDENLLSGLGYAGSLWSHFDTFLQSQFFLCRFFAAIQLA